MPQPKKGESRNDYMARCVPAVMKEGKTNDQAVGQCMGMWKSHMTKNLQQLTVNLAGDLVRDEKMGGEEYWVAPLVMMSECVATGSQGALLYPESENEKWTPAWNHKPLVAPDHPAEGSACTQDFLDKHSIGLVLNAEHDGKVRAFGWFHKKNTTKIEPRVANALKQRRAIELSTGLYVDVDWEPGEFKGQKYDGIAKNYRPDHLAILPDKIGAFSIKGGHGVLQLNEASFSEITSKLEVALYEQYAADIKKMPSLYLYVMSVYEDYCIYCFGGAYYQINYRVSSDQVSLVGDPTQVEKKVEYVPVKNTEDPTREEDDMGKKELIDKIVKHSEKTNFEESDRKHLEGLDDKRLEKIAKLADNKEEEKGIKFTTQDELDKAVAKGVDEAIAKNADEVKKKAEDIIAKNKKPPEPEKKDPPKEMTIAEYMASMPPQLRNIHNQAMKSYESEVTRLVGVITANKANVFKAEDLIKLDIDMLRNLAALAQPQGGNENTQTYAMPNFMGMGAPAQILNAGADEGGLDIPAYNTEKAAAVMAALK